MSHQLMKDAGPRLLELADKRLVEKEEKYGSSDSWMERGVLGTIEYSCKKARGYLDDLEYGLGDPAVLLADCSNHLRAMYARISMDGVIIAKILHINEFGLFIVEDIHTGMQHCFMSHRMEGSWKFGSDKSKIAAGKRVLITLTDDGKVDKACVA